MGACLSCLGLSRRSSLDSEQAHLLYSDDPYNQSGNSYGTYGGTGQQGYPPPLHTLNPEEVKKEQEALEGITRWTSDQIVEIFPHGQGHRNNSNSNTNGNTTTGGGKEPSSSSHGDAALVASIPGDKSTRSIRIYHAASRPGSRASANSQSSGLKAKRGSGSTRESRVFVKLDVDET